MREYECHLALTLKNPPNLHESPYSSTAALGTSLWLGLNKRSPPPAPDLLGFSPNGSMQTTRGFSLYGRAFADKECKPTLTWLWTVASRKGVDVHQHPKESESVCC